MRAKSILLLVVLLIGCGKTAEAPKPPPNVTVSHPAQQMVTDYIDLTGTVAASKSVDLVARVTGYLKSVNFEDGQLVEAGQLLFEIEPDQYEQQLALDKAALQQAESEYRRQVGLAKENATSTANVEKWLSQRDQDQAEVELAKINLGYTRITAPFSGRIGRHLVDPGNLVGPNVNTKLATLDEIQPIFVYFNLNERDARRIRAMLQQRGMPVPPPPGTMPVFVGLEGQSNYPYQGSLDFVNTGFSTASGTIEMRGIFKNENKDLYPGAFARVRIPLGEPQPMLVLPQSTIGNDQEGDFALVVGPDDTVQRRPVTKGPLTPEGCAIRSGLAAEDRVIVNGLVNAKPGAKVHPVNATAEKTAERQRVGMTLSSDGLCNRLTHSNTI